MPELPEVEIIKKGLSSKLQDTPLVQIKIIHSHCIYPHKTSLNQLLQQKIRNISRRGKLLIFHFSEDKLLVFHLKMTGKLILTQNLKKELDKHTHVIFQFPKHHLLFKDIRKFGFIRLFTYKELAQWSFWQNLGPEPFAISSLDFAQKIKKSKATIKSLLLNQGIIAGLGNIYTDESLFAANIHPLSKGYKIPLTQLKNLHKKIIYVLNKAINLGGSSFKDYVNTLGEKGAFQEHFAVYSRAGKNCVNCNQKLIKLKVAGRTTVLCSQCQKKYE
ncbi:MAG: bifunctional DNA-formamidopyrimidine glycosylase/DNA-(apurinic or apyrimidinic site) lyase [Desulfonauticus sp.]|nr:bifunctional DNA-formamidopyrimidine glycosylase/DNA-(apurinic or apyrimidinic site) lyase [Desulfonauticus sp.]